MKLIKKIYVLPFLTFLLLFLFSGSTFAYHKLQTFPDSSSDQYKNELVEFADQFYYFDSKGKMLSQTWKTTKEGKYYFRKNGTAATGAVPISGKRYLFSSKGILFQKGFHKAEGDTYYVTSSGTVVSGWQTINGKRYHFSSAGVMTTGWYSSGKNQYYFSQKTGVMTTGWKKISGTLHYFSKDGTLVKNSWIQNRYLNQYGEYDPLYEKSLEPLRRQIANALPSYGGRWSVYVKNLDTGVSFSINNRRIYAASLIKLFAMGAVYQKIAEGKLSESRLTSTIHNMIIVSSNSAFNTVVRSVGTTYVNSWCRAHGYNNTNQGHGLSPSNNNYGLTNGTGSNVTSVVDCGRFLESVYNGTCVSPEASRKMLNHLKGQKCRSKIPAGVPSGVTIANKTGETSSTTHDTAIVYSKGATYILCVMGDTPGRGYALTYRIPQISRMVYQYFNRY